MTKYPITDILSNNRTLYAAQNEPVELLHINGIVAICETCKGNRFPVLLERLSDDQVVVIVEEIEVKPIKEQLELW